MRLSFACAMLVIALTSGGTAGAARAQAPPPRDPSHNIAAADPQARFVPGELLVRFKPGVGADQRADVLRASGAERQRSLPVPGLELVRLERGRAVEATARALENRPQVAYAEPNWIYRASATPNDPRFGELWGLHQPSDADIDAPEAWNTTTGSANVTVAVVDTGVAYLHTDLAANIWANPGETGGGKESNGVDDDGNGYVDDHRGWDVYDTDKDPADANGHGTHVAGTIGARGNDAFGIPGVNWTVRLMPVRVLGPTGSGTNDGVVEGFIYAAANGAKVVNASLGCSGCFSQAMKDAIDAASSTLFVVAAGNDGVNNEGDPHYPCNYSSPNLVCVAATDSTDALAWFSNYGTTSVDLAAPGVGILSTWRGLDELFADGLESNFDNWTTGGTNNTWARTNEAAASGSWSATDSPGALYLQNTDSWMRKATAVSFAGRSNCAIAYDLRIDVGNDFDADWLFIEGSTNGSSWQIADAWFGNSNGQFFPVESDLSFFDGSPNVFVRFRLSTDNVAPLQAEGAHLDNIRIGCAGAGGGVNDYNSISGTSMATPHVAGVAALAWAKSPTVSVATVKSAILNGGDAIPSLSGVVLTGRRLNAKGTLALIPTFSDVPTSHPFYDYIEQMFARGITTGCFFNPSTGERRYCPLNNVTRQEMAVFIVRAKGLPLLTPGTPTFSDVPTSHPFYGHIERFFADGITTGCFFDPATGERRYCPLNNVTRQEMAVFIVRAKGLPLLNPATPTFSDVPASHPFYGHIERFFANGITNGCFFDSGTGERRFCPLDNVTREAMAAFIIRAFP